MFAAKQLVLAIDAPAITAQAAVGAHDPMARNHHGNRICAAGLGHGPLRRRLTETGGQFGISDGRAERDLAQRLPDPALKGRAADVQRQIERLPRRLDESDDAGDRFVERGVTRPQIRAWKTVLQSADERVGIVSHLNRANATIGGRHENRTERTLADGKADLGAGPPCRKALGVMPRSRVDFS